MPELVIAHDALVAELERRGIRTKIANYGGLRSQADTTKILEYRAADYQHDVAAGLVSSSLPIEQYRPIAPFGSSYHNYGAAFDLEITGTPAGTSSYVALQLAGQLAPQFGLRWGGGPDFPANRKDPPHFELAIPLSEARRRYTLYAGGASSSSIPGLPDVSALLGLGPELTPSADIPDYGDYTADDSGEVTLAYQPPQSSLDMLLIAGAAVLVALGFALRRRFLN
jgi:hypothetical protein